MWQSNTVYHQFATFDDLYTRLLLGAGASKDITRKDQQTALFVATAYQNKDVAKLLIE